jgi:hypothetical protein
VTAGGAARITVGVHGRPRQPFAAWVAVLAARPERVVIGYKG